MRAAFFALVHEVRLSYLRLRVRCAATPASLIRWRWRLSVELARA